MRNRSAVFAASMLVAAMLIPAGSALAAIYFQTESFNSPASTTANGWAGLRNTINGNNFGYSATNHTTGNPADEAGGTHARDSRAYYGDTTLDTLQASTTLTLNNRLEWRGEFVVTGWTSPNNSVYIGYTNHNKANINTNQDILGFAINEPDGVDPAKFRIISALWTSTGTAVNSNVLRLEEDVPYRFEAIYDPTAGNGTLTVDFFKLSDNSAAGTSLMPLTLAARNAGGTFNVFGFTNTVISANPAFTFNVFMDGLEYTVTPEPAGLTLVGGLMMLLSRRRSRG
jgi:hypothetical protein